MTSEEELHIASLVVHVATPRLDTVVTAIGALPNSQIHASTAAGKLVVTLEASSADAMTSMVLAIQRMEGVLSAALVYQCVDTLQAMNQEMSDAQA